MNMKITASGLAALMVAPQLAMADFVGVTYTSRPGHSDSGLTVYSFYAVFDDPDDDLAFVHGLNSMPLSIQATSGAFYQAPHGGDGPASQSTWNAHLSVQDDSFVTIGSPYIPTGADDFLVLQGWAPVSPTFNNEGLIWGDDNYGVWVAVDPDNQWGSPGSWGRAGNYSGNSVLFAQLTVASGGIVANDVTLAYLDGDWAGTESGILTHVTQSFSVGATCPADLTGDNIVNVLDLLDMLGAWGSNPGHPADLNGDNVVNVLDLLQMLGAWGAC